MSDCWAKSPFHYSASSTRDNILERGLEEKGGKGGRPMGSRRPKSIETTAVSVQAAVGQISANRWLESLKPQPEPPSCRSPAGFQSAAATSTAGKANQASGFLVHDTF